MHKSTVTGSDFVGGKVNVDNTRFVKCNFKGALLAYSGGGAPAFEHCAFDSVNWALEGEAGNTLELLRSLYQSPFKPVVDQVIQFIVSSPGQQPSTP